MTNLYLPMFLFQAIRYYLQEYGGENGTTYASILSRCMCQCHRPCQARSSMPDLGDLCQLATALACAAICSLISSVLYFLQISSVLYFIPALICSDSMFSVAMCMTHYVRKKGATVTSVMYLMQCLFSFLPQLQTASLV